MKRKGSINSASIPYSIKTRSKTEAEKQLLSTQLPITTATTTSTVPKNEEQPAQKKRKSTRSSKNTTQSKEEHRAKEKLTMSEKNVSRESNKKKGKADTTAHERAEDREDSEERERVKPLTSTTAVDAAVSPATASTTLQGLMRRLGGTALEELLPVSGSRADMHPAVSISTLIEGRSRLKTLLQGLKSDNESQQLESIMELSDYLSMGTEDSLAGFATDQFVPALINLLNCEHNPDMMLMACRALSHLMEALPAACSSIVHHGAVPSLCSKLLSIEYIDLAEQTLQALEKLSVEHPAAVLRAGGLTAVLTYLDFFPTGVQRVAVSTAANICRQVPHENFDMILDSIPILTNLLQYPDQKVVENACLCFSRLAENFVDSESKLQALTSHGLLGHLVRLISVSNTSAVVISPATYTIVVRLLATICHGAPSVALTLLQEGIASILQGVLAGSTTNPSNSATTTLSRSPQQCYEILSLINELLPKLPADIANLMTFSGKVVGRDRPRRIRKTDEAEPKTDVDPREEILKSHPALLVNFGQSLFIVLVDMFTSTVNPSVRYKCLSTITKILYFSTADMLYDLLRNFAFSSFVAGLLASRDNAVVAVALKMAEIMMDKLPDVFSKYFRREGVVYEVERLSKMDISGAKEGPSPLFEPPLSSSPSAEHIISSPPSHLLPTATHALNIPHPSTPPHSSVPPSMSSSPSSAAFFYVGSPASVQAATNANPQPNDELKSDIYMQARTFQEKYFKAEKSDSSATEELRHLQDLSTVLNKSSDLHSNIDVQNLTAISSMLTAPEGVSTFEFLRSGLVENLLCYLTKLDESEEQGVHRRACNFAHVFLGLPAAGAASTAITTTSNNNNSHNNNTEFGAFSVLVAKLHDALNKLERFPVQVNDTPGTASGLKYLTQPFKLKLQKEGTNDLIKDYSSNIVLIEPLATVTAIEDFLLPRVKNTAPAEEEKGGEAEKEKEKAAATGGAERKTREKPKRKEKSRKAEDDTKPGEGKRMKEEKAEAEKKQEVDKMETDEKVEEKSIHTEDSSETGESEGMDFYDDYDEYDEEEVMPPGTEQGETERVHDLKLNEDILSSTPPKPSFSMRSSTSSTPTSTSSATTTTTVTTTTTSTTTTPATTAATTTSPFMLSAQQVLSNMKLAFFVNDQRLPSTMTIFQAVQKIARDQATLESPQPVHRMWETVYTLKYRLVPADSHDGSIATETSATTKEISANLEPVGSSSLMKFLIDLHPFSISTSDSTYEILSLIRVLNEFNKNWSTLYQKSASIPLLPAVEFINNRLTAKLLRQLQDPLTICSGSLPPWCKQLVVACPFLFPFDCRRQFWYSTSFGIARALQALQQRSDVLRLSGERNDFRIGRIQRQKVRISRGRLLESAMKVVELYGKNKAILEVEYFGEVGTGLGPTLEFFTLVSRELQKKELNIWWDDNPSSTVTTTSTALPSTAAKRQEEPAASKDIEYVFSPGGLFPAPLRPGKDDFSRKIEIFKFAGSFLAKALLDNRLLDVPLSTPFVKWLLGQELTFDDFAEIAPSIAKSLENLRKLVYEKRSIEGDVALTPSQREQKIQSLKIGGSAVDDLCLDFTLPGYPDWELKPNGLNTHVNISNLEEYINLVLRHFLVDGVQAQFRAFVDGFNQVLPLENMNIFTPPEVELLVCGSVTGSAEDWGIESLLDTIKADHGYSSDSQAMRFLVEIMAEFSPAERRKFLLFLTGSPRLPISGFKGLNPKFTVVKKHHTPPFTPDDHLPSVMSCTNYLKLPDYSSKNVMKQKILYAIEEGQGSFHLS